MNGDQKKDLVIQEFRDSQAKLRSQISDLKDQEARLFRKMLDDLESLHYPPHPYPNSIMCEHERALVQKV